MRNSGMKLGMVACCAIMVVPLVGYFVAGGSFALSGGALGAVLPLATCIGLHGAMLLFMRKSCHSEKETLSTEKALSEFEPPALAQPGAQTARLSTASHV